MNEAIAPQSEASYWLEADDLVSEELPRRPLIGPEVPAKMARAGDSEAPNARQPVMS